MMRIIKFGKALTKSELDSMFSPFDLKRLEGYSNNLIDYHVIMDLLPLIARLFFSTRFPFNLSAGQSAILLGLGLQHKTVEEVSVNL
jgi:N-acetyltransferase 10